MAVIGIDMNTFNPGIVHLSVNMTIALKVDCVHDHEYGFLKHYLLGTMINTQGSTTYSKFRQVHDPN